MWVQLRNRIIYLVDTGFYSPGDQLPSVRSLAAEASINYNTVSRVYVDLERDGYVKSHRGRGVFVLERPKKGAGVTTVADAVLEEAVRRCLAMGMSVDEVCSRVESVVRGLRGSARQQNARQEGSEGELRTDDQEGR